MYSNYSPYYNPYYPNNGAMPDNLNQLRSQPQPVQQNMQPAQPPVQPMQNNSGIVWGLGEANSVPSMRIYDYAERTLNPPVAPENASKTDVNIDWGKFVTRDELNEILANLTPVTTEKTKKSKGDTDNG